MTDNANTQASTDKNQHIRDFLSRYIDLPYPPYYAVLLTGPWGIGKTYLIKQFLREQFGEDGKENSKKPIYVSLYGLTSVDELDTALFQAAYSALKWKGTLIAGRLGKTALKFFQADPKFTFADFPTPKADLYVFDDLDRCEMPINKSLGYINEFVEHEGRKVVIIANEQEIKDKKEYARRREKLIGKTFEVQSVLDQAFNSFIDLVGDPKAKSFMETRKADISDVYAQSGLNNLRILQQTIWDFSHFFGALTERYLNNDEGATALLRSFFALSFEFKSGRLCQEDLRNWFSTSMEYMILQHDEEHSNQEPSRCEAAIKRYHYGIDLSGTVGRQHLSDRMS